MLPSASELNIEFVESRVRYAKDGAPRATCDYVFAVKGVEVVVSVHAIAILTIDGVNLTPDEVVMAARTFAEIELEKVGSFPPGTELVLGGDEMQLVVAPRLGWIDRFIRRH